jgi:hypothetical protein
MKQNLREVCIIPASMATPSTLLFKKNINYLCTGENFVQCSATISDYKKNQVYQLTNMFIAPEGREKLNLEYTYNT